MRIVGLLMLLLAAEIASFAQLTLDQKLTDFRELVGLLDKRYAPYEWKKQLFQFDLLDSQPWLDRVAQSTTDLDYYQVCVDYVASLQDASAYYMLPSNFVARLGFSVDVFDGRVFVVSVNRTMLPASVYPFASGDELISLDGMSAVEWLDALAKYDILGSQRATQHGAAFLLTNRFQQLMPHAVDVGDSATVVVQRRSGATETYTVPWVKTGQPLATGPVLTPQAEVVIRSLTPEGPHADVPAPSGPRLPSYPLPAGFVQRLGRTSADLFLSGTYVADGRMIGYLRIGTFTQSGAALGQLDAEIAYFQQNVDGLVVDTWGAGGSTTCYAEQIAARFIAHPFLTVGYQLRATHDWVSRFESVVNTLIAQRAPQSQIDQQQAYLDIVSAAYQENRGLTDPVSLCNAGLTHDPAAAVYTKHLLVLINELTSRTAENLVVTLQDAGRGIFFGTPTAGVGTVSSAYSVGSYGEGVLSVSTAIAVRPSALVTQYPPATYIETIGARPDVSYETYTLDKLRTGGVDYVNAFTQAVLDLLAGR